MDNQQQQPVDIPTNDFLVRMDMAANPQPAQPKKKLPRGAVIGIIAGVAVIFITILTIIVINIMKPAPVPEPEPINVPDTPEVDIEIIERNSLRANDLDIVSDAVKSYQAAKDANGQLPGPDAKEWEKLLKVYIPQGVYDGADETKYAIGGVCIFGESCVDISSLSWENDAHKIFALYNADCNGKTRDNVVVSSTRKRRVAIFAVIENNEFICVTN